MDEARKKKIIQSVDQIGTKDTARKLFMSDRQLHLLLESWGHPIRKKRIKQEIPARETLLKLYRQYGTTVKLAEHFNVGVNTTNNWLKELNIPARKMKMSSEEKVRFLEEHLEKLGSFNL